MKKKVLSLVLASVMCLGLTVPTFAAETKSITLEIFGIVVTMNGYLRTELYKSEDGITFTIYVVEDGSTVELKAMDGFRYVTEEELSTRTGEFFDYVAAHGNGMGSGYAWVSGPGGGPLTGPLTGTIDPPPHSYGIGYFDYYYCSFVCESDLAFPANGMERIPDQSTVPAKSETAAPTNDKLTVNGVLTNPTVYKIDGSNYFKIRDVAALLNGTEKQFAVGYDGALNSVTATIGQGYKKLPTDLAGAPTGGNQSAEPSNDTIYVNGVKIDAQVYKINGSNYFKLRDLGKALNFSVDWTQEAGMIIDTSRPYSE